MTMRTGPSYCTKHVTMDEFSRTKSAKKAKSLALIFCDIELGWNGTTMQIAACLESGERISATIWTSVRADTSPVLSKVSIQGVHLVIRLCKFACSFMPLITLKVASESTSMYEGDGLIPFMVIVLRKSTSS